jgi:hypothetical protein
MMNSGNRKVTVAVQVVAHDVVITLHREVVVVRCGVVLNYELGCQSLPNPEIGLTECLLKTTFYPSCR